MLKANPMENLFAAVSLIARRRHCQPGARRPLRLSGQPVATCGAP